MIIKSYLNREILTVFAAVFCLLLLIFLSRNMVDFLTQAAAGRISADAIISLMFLLTLTTLTLLLPLAFFISVLLALGRLKRDNELTAIIGTGQGGAFFYGTVGRLGLWLAIALALLALVFNPWGVRKMKEIEAKAQEQSDVSAIQPGRFKEFNDGRRILFVDQISKNKHEMEQVFLQTRDEQDNSVLSAARAGLATDEGTGNRFVIFNEGRRYDGEPGRADFEVTEYQRLGVRVEQSSIKKIDSTRAIPTTQLFNSSDPAYRAELQWRLASPIAALLLSWLGVALIRQSTKQNRYAVVVVGVLLFLVYNNLISISKTLIKKEQISDAVGMWWVHLLMLMIVLTIEYLPAYLAQERLLKANANIGLPPKPRIPAR